MMRPALAISVVTVAIDPGPAKSGMASGKMATSSFSAPSCSSAGVVLARACCRRSISMEERRSKMPPATLKAPSVTPKTRKMSVPATAKVVRMKNAATEARSAMSLRFSGGSSRVMPMKMGTTTIGSTTKKIAESESRLKLSHSLIMRGALYHRFAFQRHPGKSRRGMIEEVPKSGADAPREPEANYRDLVENASDIIYTRDLEGRFTWVNKAWERITGYSREEGLVLRIWDILSPEDVERVKSAVERKLSGEGQLFEGEIIHKDGHRVPLDLTSRPVSPPASPPL